MQFPQLRPLVTASCPLQQPNGKATVSVLPSLHYATKCFHYCLPPTAAHEEAIASMVSLPSIFSSGWMGRPLPACWPAF